MPNNNIIKKEELNFDWQKQRYEINERLTAKQSWHLHPVWKWSFGLVSVAIIVVASILWLVNFRGQPGVEQEQVFAETEIDETYIPQSLYVLNGFTSGEATTNYESLNNTADYILAVEEEEL